MFCIFLGKDSCSPYHCLSCSPVHKDFFILLKFLSWTWPSHLFISSHCSSLSKLSKPIPPGCPQTPNSPHFLLSLAEQFCPLHLISSALLSPWPFLIPPPRITHGFPQPKEPPICAMKCYLSPETENEPWFFFLKSNFFPLHRENHSFNINICLCASA